MMRTKAKENVNIYFSFVLSCKTRYTYIL